MNMLLTPQNQGPDIDTCAAYEVARTDTPAIVSLESRLDFDQPRDFSLQRRFFSHGRQDLALHSDLIGEHFFNVGVLRLKGWGIEVTFGDQREFNLDREIIRKFLDLYSKAETNRLSDVDRKDWASIVDQVDYQRFCAERSPEIYMEGKLLQREDEGWRVAWHDGTEQSIPREASQQLTLVNEGERFGAMVKFDKNREVQSLTRLTFIAESAATSEELWQSWATAGS